MWWEGRTRRGTAIDSGCQGAPGSNFGLSQGIILWVETETEKKADLEGGLKISPSYHVKLSGCALCQACLATMANEAWLQLMLCSLSPMPRCNITATWKNNLIVILFFRISVFKSRYNLHIKHPSKMYDSLVFSIFTKFCNYHHYLISKHFHHPKQSPVPISSHFPFPPSFSS